MCLIVHQPKGHSFNEKELADILERNADGFGVMWIDDDGELTWRKFVGPREYLTSQYFHFAAGREAVCHWRMATSGPKDVDHAHPFQVTDQLAVMHNGVFGSLGNAKASDTAIFVTKVLQPLMKHNAITDPDIQAVIRKAIEGSALVFMDHKGKVHKFGYTGVEYRGCWYSNTYAWSAPSHLTRSTWGKGNYWQGYDDDEDMNGWVKDEKGDWIRKFRSKSDRVIDLTAASEPTKDTASNDERELAEWFQRYRRNGGLGDSE